MRWQFLKIFRLTLTIYFTFSIFFIFYFRLIFVVLNTPITSAICRSIEKACTHMEKALSSWCTILTNPLVFSMRLSVRICRFFTRNHARKFTQVSLTIFRAWRWSEKGKWENIFGQVRDTERNSIFVQFLHFYPTIQHPLLSSIIHQIFSTHKKKFSKNIFSERLDPFLAWRGCRGMSWIPLTEKCYVVLESRKGIIFRKHFQFNSWNFQLLRLTYNITASKASHQLILKSIGIRSLAFSIRPSLFSSKRRGMVVWEW